MKVLLLYILFPLMAFLLHLVYLNLLLRGIPAERKRFIALLNILFYPAVMSFFVAFFFAWARGVYGLNILTALCAGFMGYYLSMLLSLTPFLGPFFREPDMEFLLLGLFVAMGVFHPSPWKFLVGLGPLLVKRSFLLVLALVSALIISTLVKYLISQHLFPYQGKEDALKAAAWSVSLTAAVMGVPVVIFFQML